ncbi:hypothetical protein ANN_26527 [Periplaneta americana]|uniref:Transposase Tc1-like domain-containing protein n=1 Tax=Periplaneta americana TaxID=6978 RepID=A0ABQ8RYH2_PERAM|nr:hypothetical protein ANN_26527 [Periplaneta americana]
MAGLCEGGNEPSGSVKAICKLVCRSSTRVCVRICVSIRRPEFECSGPQLEGPEFEYSELSLKAPMRDAGINISSMTTRRRLKELEFSCRSPTKKPFLKPYMVKKRVSWAKQHQCWTVDDWKKSGKDLGRCLNTSALTCPHRKNRRVQGLVTVLARGSSQVKKLSVRETSVSGLGEKYELCERWLHPAETIPGQSAAH